MTGGVLAGRWLRDVGRWSPRLISSPPMSSQAEMPPLRDWLLLAFTFACGVIDAISLLGLGRVFTSMMTGNLIFLGLALGHAEAIDLARTLTALLAFCIGVALGSLVIGRDTTHVVWPKRVTSALALEVVLLAIFAICWQLPGLRASDSGLALLIATSSAAFGIQNTAAVTLTFTSPGKTAVPGTAYLTGTLTSLILELIERREPEADIARRLLALGALIAGAGSGAFMLYFWPPLAPVLPLAIVTTVVACAGLAWGIEPSLRRVPVQSERFA